LGPETGEPRLQNTSSVDRSRKYVSPICLNTPSLTVVALGYNKLRLSHSLILDIEVQQKMKVLRELFRAKRAFSPVIASLILMLLAVASGVVVYAYVMGWIGGATGTPGGTKGELQFDSIYADATSDVIKIYVRNVGSKDLLLSKIYVDGTEKANATAIPDAGVSITVQSVKYLQVSHTMTAPYSYEVKVTCKDGTSVSQSVEAE